MTKRREVPLWVWRHPANEDAKVRSLLRFAAFQLRGRLGRRETQARVGLQGRVAARIGQHSASSAVYANPPDWPEMTLWRKLINSGDTVLDIGSNVGLYAVWFADCGAQVDAYEPGTANFQELRRNLALNPTFKITLHQLALSNNDGHATLHGSGTTASLVDSGAAQTQSLGQLVETRTLDQLYGDRHVLGAKIDVEGHELEVLQGASRMLANQKITYLQLEWNGVGVSPETLRATQELLHENGYSLIRPSSGKVWHPDDRESPCPPGSDVFATPRAYIHNLK